MAVRLVGQAGTRGYTTAEGTTDQLGDVQPSRRAYFGDVGAIETPVITRKALSDSQDGPLFIDEFDSTIVVPPEACVHPDEFGNVIMEIG